MDTNQNPPTPYSSDNQLPPPTEKSPFTSLPLYWFNYQLGCWLIGPGVGWPGLDDLQTGRIWNSGGGFINRLLLGSTLVGVACAVLGGWLYWHWLEREHRRGKRQG
jgi:uncharacterized protein (DUF2062 family)